MQEKKDGCSANGFERGGGGYCACLTKDMKLHRPACHSKRVGENHCLSQFSWGDTRSRKESGGGGSSSLGKRKLLCLLRFRQRNEIM